MAAPAAPAARISGIDAEWLFGLHLPHRVKTLVAAAQGGAAGRDVDATAAALAALAALAAPAYALPAPPADASRPQGVSVDEGVEWKRWMRLALKTTTCWGFRGTLALLLADARLADAALALCVPLCAALAFDEQQCGASGAAAPRAVLASSAVLQQCTALLLAAACADAPRGGAARTARVLRVLTDCVLLRRCGAVAAWLKRDWQTVTTALVALLRRAPADAHDAMPGGAANLLCHMLRWQTWQRESPYRAAVWAAAVAALPAACGASAAAAQPARHAFGGFAHGLLRSRCVLPAFEMCSLLARSVAATHNASPASKAREKTDVSALRQLLQAQPGGLAAFARCVALSAASLPEHAHTHWTLLHLLLASRSSDDDADTDSPSWLCRWALLDEELCLSELLAPLACAEARMREETIELLVASCEDDVTLERLRHPPHDAAGRAAVSAAATAALLASRSEDALRLLKCEPGSGARTLARAYIASCCAQKQQQQQQQQQQQRGKEASVEEPWHEALPRRLYHERLRAALSAAAAAAGLHRAPPHAAPLHASATTSRTGAAQLLGAADVNVRRYDSLTLWVSGRPLYVNGMLLEKASPLLADLLSSCIAAAPPHVIDKCLLPLLPALVLPPPGDVAPAAFHALMCAAVEHTYTGALQAGLPAESLLPLWCVARHLQLDALAAACAAALLPALRAQPRALLRDTVRAAARHRCQELMQHAAAAVLMGDGAERRERCACGCGAV
jgi:hypothetical protein